jgi:hypothetical protein
MTPITTVRGCSRAQSAENSPDRAGRAIPLLFRCNAGKFGCSADLIPLFLGAAEMGCKRLIYRDILGDESGHFTSRVLFFR